MLFYVVVLRSNFKFAALESLRNFLLLFIIAFTPAESWMGLLAKCMVIAGFVFWLRVN